MRSNGRVTPNGNKPLTYDERIELKAKVARAAITAEGRARYVDAMAERNRIWSAEEWLERQSQKGCI